MPERPSSIRGEFGELDGLTAEPLVHAPPVYAVPPCLGPPPDARSIVPV